MENPILSAYAYFIESIQANLEKRQFVTITRTKRNEIYSNALRHLYLALDDLLLHLMKEPNFISSPYIKTLGYQITYDRSFKNRAKSMVASYIYCGIPDEKYVSLHNTDG